MESRPYINLLMIMSIDGKVTGNFLSSEKCIPFLEIYSKKRKEFPSNGFICGKTTMSESYTHNFHPNLNGFKGKKLKGGDYIANAEAKSYAVAFDTHGTLGWKIGHLPESKDKHVIEIISQDVDPAYLSYLQGIRCSYLFSGEDNIIIPLALKKLKKFFGIKYLVLEGGSTINGAFLREKCIDEINVIMVPITGESGDKSLFTNGVLERFTLVKSEPVGDGGILLNYKVKNELEEESDESDNDG